METVELDSRYLVDGEERWHVGYYDDANHSLETVLNSLEAQGFDIFALNYHKKLRGGYILGVPGWSVVARRRDGT